MTDAEVEECLANLIEAERAYREVSQARDDLLGRLGAANIEFKLTIAGASWRRAEQHSGSIGDDHAR